MTAASQKCPKCGQVLVPDALGGLCPDCLARLAFALEEMGDSGNPAGSLVKSKLRYFGNYELLEEIARGGAGVVYKARQLSLNRLVAVKMLLFGRLAKEEYVQRFRAEAEAAANLQHPNIVAIHEVGEHEGQHYFSMEYVDGQSLAERARDNPLPPALAVEYVRTIAGAIHYAHQRGILHRDLKPSNVLIDAHNQPRVTDFGLAKRLISSEPGTANPELTMTGQVLGTPGYMSPEQAQGRRETVTVASDVYSLGAVLYFLLAGRAPFAADSLEATLRQVLESDPVAPRLLNPAVPRDLQTICLKCLEKEPRKRYATACELAEELGRFLNGETICARPVSRPEKLWRWCRRKPALAALIVALHLVGAAGLAGVLWQWRRAEQHAARETAQRLRAQEAVTLLELQRAEDLLEKDEVVMGVAHLSRMVRQQPTNRIAAQRLLSALAQRNFALPVGLPLQHGKKVQYAEFSPEGNRVATASLDFTARIWDARTGEPLTAPMLHRDAVRIAHFSPDGRRLVTCGDDSRAHLWETTTGLSLGQPMTHTKKIRTAEFSPDGRRVLTASEDGTARVWDAHTGGPTLEPIKHQGPVRWARFSLDGRWIVTASEDKTARVWDALTGQPAAKPLQHRSGVDKAEFSPDGKWVVTVAKDFSTCVWDAVSGERLTKPLVHRAAVDTARFSPDGARILVSLHDGLTRIFNARDWAPLPVSIQHRGWTASAEFGPDAQRILTGSLDNTARLWDAASGEALTPPMQHDGLIWSARFSPDGMSAVTASADGTARLWDVRLGRVCGLTMNHAAPVFAAEFSPDGDWIVTASKDGTARIWDARTGQRREPELRHAGSVVAAEFSRDGERIATASSDHTARIWNARTGQPLTGPLRHKDSVNHLRFSSDGHWLATASADGEILLWNGQTGTPAGEPIRHRARVRFVCFSPDGQRLLSGDAGIDQVEIHDVASGRLLAETPAREGQALYGEFSPDGQRVLTTCEEGAARIWNARTGQPLTQPLRHKGGVPYARFSRDGRWVVTASDDTTAQVWDAQTGQPIGEPLRHRREVNTAEFSPDGLLIVTASDDGTARVWDAQTGRPVTDPFPHRGIVRSAHFSPDGRRVLTACDAGSAQVWDVPPTIPLLGLRGNRSQGADIIRQIESPGVLLADLAETVIGTRVTAQGALVSVSSAGLAEVRNRLSALPRDADFTHWLEWFFADRSTRTLSPYSPVSLPEYLLSSVGETNFAAWHEALLLCPTNGMVFGRMARGYLQQSNATNSPAAAQADWASRQAVRFAPWDGFAWHVRRWTLERVGDWTQLLAEAEVAIQLQPTKPYAWHAKARALEGLQQFDAVIPACNRALELWQADKTLERDQPLRQDILLQRSIALRFLGRLAEASADRVASLGLPARDPQAGVNLIDLGAFYTGVVGQGLPGGVQRLAGTDFDFRGWVHLDLRLVQPEVRNLPERVDGIPVGRSCQRLHFLHTASFASHVAPNGKGVREEVFDAPLGVAVGHYVIHYADGQQMEIPILHGRDVRDHWRFPESTPDDPALVVAWTSSSAHSRRAGATTRLYKQTWENPRPSVPIRSLDFVHARTHAVPILVAITAEP